MNHARTANKRRSKHTQILEGARTIFMERGFEGATVDDIARAAGTSKATLYGYFPDKERLFEAVMEEQCVHIGEMMAEASLGRPGSSSTGSTFELLRTTALSFASFLVSAGAQEMFRICIAEAGRFPQLAEIFRTSGPGRAHGRLMAVLDIAAKRGDLVLRDPQTAASQFAVLCGAEALLQTLMGAAPPTKAQLARGADEAVRTFLARYGKEGATGHALRFSADEDAA